MRMRTWRRGLAAKDGQGRVYEIGSEVRRRHRECTRSAAAELLDHGIDLVLVLHVELSDSEGNETGSGEVIDEGAINDDC